MSGSVLYVIDGLELGGGERGVLQLVGALRREGWPVAVAAHPGRRFEAEARAAGADFAPVPMHVRAAPSAIARLRRLAQSGRFTIVHSQGARADVLTRLALAGVHGIHHVCTVQMPVEGFDVGPLRRALYVALDRATAPRVDRFIVVSEALHELLVEHRGVEPERVALIHNGVETGEPPPAPEARRARRRALGLDPDRPLVGTAGRLVWQKGFEDLVRALPAIVAAVPGTRLLVAGEGPGRAGLEALARQQAVEGAVIFTGFRPDVPALLGALDVFVLPSRREGFPLVTLEAMAQGTPVVATAIPGVLEQIRHGLEGLLVPAGRPEALAAAVATLLDDRRLATRLASAARRRVQAAFDVRVMAERTLALYRGLIGAALVTGSAS